MEAVGDAGVRGAVVAVNVLVGPVIGSTAAAVVVMATVAAFCFCS